MPRTSRKCRRNDTADPSPLRYLIAGLALAIIVAAVIVCTRRPVAIADALELDDYRYLHATRAELLRRTGRRDEARAALDRALALADDEVERRLLERRLAELDSSAS